MAAAEPSIEQDPREEGELTLRFIARRSVYFWLGAVLWTFAPVYAILAATVLDLVGAVWLAIGIIGLAASLLAIGLAIRSGITIRQDGSIAVVDGVRSWTVDAADLQEFVIVDSVAPLAAPLVLLGGGPFAPDRLGLLSPSGETIKLHWSFANHDDIRLVRKQLNARLRSQRSPRADA